MGIRAKFLDQKGFQTLLVDSRPNSGARKCTTAFLLSEEGKGKYLRITQPKANRMKPIGDNSPEDKKSSGLLILKSLESKI